VNVNRARWLARNKIAWARAWIRDVDRDPET
jgi:hypothetical protein